MAFPILKWFRSKEFQYPDLCNPVALELLDQVREQYGKPLIITDDARIRGDDLPPGASETSWHYTGQAFDLRIKDMTKEDLWRFVAAVMNVATWVARGQKKGVEFELVWSKTDKHAHIAFKMDGSANEFLIRTE